MAHDEMTEKVLVKLCQKHNLYRTPYLNDVLYLHYQAFRKIENLDKYTGLKCLWLESNSIEKIEGLNTLTELRSLFLQKNFITQIENLQNNLLLDHLNLSENRIERINNLSHLKNLRTLNLSQNFIRKREDLQELLDIEGLSVVDLSNNRIDDLSCIDVFGKMSDLRVLYLMGNPIVRSMPVYRKTLILSCSNLKYLDDRPVFDKERALANAWLKGGPEEEETERQRWINQEQKVLMDSVNACLSLKSTDKVAE